MLDPILKLDASTPGQEKRFLAEARAKFKPVSGTVKLTGYQIVETVSGPS